jgi:hypothetical protein
MRQIVVPVYNLQPDEFRSITVTVKMRPDVLLFERKVWRGEIQLRKRLSSTAKNLLGNFFYDILRLRVRCAAIWSEFPSMPRNDLVLFAGHGMSANEFLTWSKLATGLILFGLCSTYLLLGLNLNIRVWDYDYYQGISFNMNDPTVTYDRRHATLRAVSNNNNGEILQLHDMSWKRMNGEPSPLLVFCFNPEADDADLIANYWALQFRDLIQHFPCQEDVQSDSLFKNSSRCLRWDDGMIFYGLDSKILIEGNHHIFFP